MMVNMVNPIARQRRAKKTREKIKRLNINRLCVHKTSRHIYAQIISFADSNVLASSSTVDKEVKSQIKYGGNVEAAIVVGKILAERAKKVGVEQVAFDRSGFPYHGRIRALADSAREHGMKF